MQKTALPDLMVMEKQLPAVGISLILDNGATKLPLMLISNTNMRSNVFDIQNTKKTKNKKNVKNK